MTIVETARPVALLVLFALIGGCGGEDASTKPLVDPEPFRTIQAGVYGLIIPAQSGYLVQSCNPLFITSAPVRVDLTTGAR
jgi:hypothetical protein